MGRIPIFAFCSLLAGCATGTKPPPKTSLEEECERNAAHDKRCIEVLTTANGGYESREEVMKKEQSRQADEFHNRLARLRREEEQRQRARDEAAQTSTIAPSDRPRIPEEEDALAPLASDAAARNEDEEDGSASSIRALRPAEANRTTNGETPPVPPRERLATTERKAPDPRVTREVRDPGPSAGIVREAPTPEAYFRAALCLLGSDVALLKSILAKGMRSAGDRAKDPALGAAALVIFDADALAASIRDEMRHRGLPEIPSTSANCTTHPLAEVVDLVRSLVGPPAERVADASAWQRGVVRLQRELEVRAGLPKPK